MPENNYREFVRHMHELSIAHNIVEITEEQAKQADIQKVQEIVIEIGSLSGVVIESLQTAMDSAIKNTILQHAHVVITEVPAKARCNRCGNVFPVSFHYDLCPECNSIEHEIIQGEELKVISISGE